MRRFRVLVIELVAVPILLGWLFVNYPEIFDVSIPWVALAVLWHLTWEFVLEANAFKNTVRRVAKKAGAMIWMCAFLMGGLVSLAYLASVRTGLRILAQVHEQHLETLKLTFTNSPALTPDRKTALQKEIGRYSAYLKKVGFPSLDPFPIIGTRPGKPPDWEDGRLDIGEDSLDDTAAVRAAFGMYYFTHQFVWSSKQTGPEKMSAAAIYNVYFLESYVGKHTKQGATLDERWEDALWDIREKFEKQMTDKAMYLGFSKRGEIVKREDVNTYLRIMVESGMFEIANNKEGALTAVREILSAHGLMAASETADEARPKTPARPAGRPPTLADLFITDFPNLLKARQDNFSLKSNADGTTVVIRRQVYMDFGAKAQFVGFYIPYLPAQDQNKVLAIALALVDAVQPTVETLDRNVTSGGDAGGVVSAKDLVFSGRVFLYHEQPLSNLAKAKIIEAYEAKHYDVSLRGLDYAALAVAEWLRKNPH